MDSRTKQSVSRFLVKQKRRMTLHIFLMNCRQPKLISSSFFSPKFSEFLSFVFKTKNNKNLEIETVNFFPDISIEEKCSFSRLKSAITILRWFYLVDKVELKMLHFERKWRFLFRADYSLNMLLACIDLQRLKHLVQQNVLEIRSKIINIWNYT